MISIFPVKNHVIHLCCEFLRPNVKLFLVACIFLHILFILIRQSSNMCFMCSTGSYHNFSPYGNGNASQHTRGFADWGMHNNALMSLAHSTTTFGSGINGFQQNFSSYNTHTWTTTYMPRNPYNTVYGHANMNMMIQNPSFHNNNNTLSFPDNGNRNLHAPSFPNNINRNHEKDSGTYIHMYIWNLKRNICMSLCLCMQPHVGSFTPYYCRGETYALDREAWV